MDSLCLVTTGSIALIPSFVVFPIGHTLVQHGTGLQHLCPH
ncbi:MULTISPECIES: hypothetical protein [Bacillus]|nr:MULTISPECIES: hypothetical protein [Bacillus]